MASRNSAPIRLLLLVFALVLPASLARAAESARLVRAELGVAGELFVGPEPPVGDHGAPLGVSASLRRAAYPGVQPGPDGTLLVAVAVGWHVTARAAIVAAPPAQELFTPLRLVVPRVEAGPSFLVGYALGSGIEVDLGFGGGLYAGRFGLGDDSFAARRALLAASLGMRSARERSSLEIRLARLALLDEMRRAFTTVTLQATLVLVPGGGGS